MELSEIVQVSDFKADLKQTYKNLAIYWAYLSWDTNKNMKQTNKQKILPQGVLQKPSGELVRLISTNDI